MNGNIWFILKILPYLGACSLIAGFVGWYLRHKLGAQRSHHAEPVSHAADDQVRIKKLQEKVHKAEAASKSMSNELDAMRSGSVSKAEHEAAVNLMREAQKSLELEKQRASSLEADLKKSQETVSGLHTKANAGVKEEKSRIFALENELSKARAELLGLQGKGDDSSELRKELERMRDSVANATRFAGEARKREAALAEELESNKAKWERGSAIANPVFSAPAPRAVAMPAIESDNVTKARAEVARLQTEREQMLKEEAQQAAAAPVALEQNETDVAAVIDPIIAEMEGAVAPSQESKEA